MGEIKEHKGFVVGEKVICILNNRSSLTVGKEYIIDSLEVYSGDENFWICVINDIKVGQAYHYSRFISKGDFRKHIIDDILK
jgi:hypothetical protein